MSNQMKLQNKSSLLACTALLALTVGTIGTISAARAGDDVNANGTM